MMMIRAWLRQNVKVVVVGGLLLLLFIYWRFPMDAFRPKLEQQLQRLLPGTQVHIGSLQTTLLPGIRLRDVQLRSSISNSSLTLQRIDLNLVLRHLLLRKMTLKFHVQAKNIGLKGQFSRGILGRDLLAFLLQLNKFNLNLLYSPGVLQESLMDPIRQSLARMNPLLSALTLQGELSGRLQLSGPKQAMQSMEMLKLNGQVQLGGKGMMIEGLVPGGLDLGKLTIETTLDDERVRVSKVQASGKDLSLSIQGDVKLEAAPKPSVSNLEFRLSVPADARGSISGSLNMALVPLGIEFKNGQAAFKMSGPLGGRLPPKITPLNTP